MNTKLAETVKKRMDELGIKKQVELAKLSGVSKDYIRRILGGEEREYKTETYEKLAKALKMHPMQLQYGVSIPDTKKQTETVSQQDSIKPLAIALSQVLKAIRKSLHLSIEDFAKKCRLTIDDLEAIESGEIAYLRRDKQFKILRTLGIPHTWFDFATEPSAPLPIDKDQREIIEDLKDLSPSQKKLIKNMIHEMKSDSK